MIAGLGTPALLRSGSPGRTHRPPAEEHSAGTRIGRAARLLRYLPALWPAFNACWQLRRAERRGRVLLRGRAKVVADGTLAIGDRVRIDSTVARVELATLPGGRLEIGDDVFVNYGSSVVASTHVKIGDGCLIGTHAMIMDCDFHRVEDKRWDTSGQPIVIEDRVWIANRAIVLKGVRIGHDAVVAAGAVVTKDVPPRSVAAGVPATVVRRF